jgi:hypothetical protein
MSGVIDPIAPHAFGECACQTCAQQVRWLEMGIAVARTEKRAREFRERLAQERTSQRERNYRWIAKHPEAWKTYHDHWRRRNRDLVNAAQRRYKARKRLAEARRLATVAERSHDGIDDGAIASAPG